MFKKPYILVIVEDEQEIAEILEESIEDLFPNVFDIQSFQRPKAAFEYIENNSVSIVITDVKMPEMNGDHLNMKIKKLNRGIQTIIVTGVQNFTITMTCFRNGANSFIAKPFDNDDVDRALKRCLESLEDWGDIFSRFTVANRLNTGEKKGA